MSNEHDLETAAELAGGMTPNLDTDKAPVRNDVPAGAVERGRSPNRDLSLTDIAEQVLRLPKLIDWHEAKKMERPYKRPYEKGNLS